MDNGQKICSRCILDSTVPSIVFNEKGECNYCMIHDKQEKIYPLGRLGEKKLNDLVEKIKKTGKNQEYDCIIGVSGGTDSTYTLYLAKKFGLRPLAVHFDNGWDSEIAVNNIKKATTKLNIDLHTLVADWEEFKDLQIAFLKASVPDAEIPTDYAIYSTLFQVAAEEGIHYVIEGHSFRSEGTSPIGWTYMDGRYIKSVHKKFGKRKIKSFPILSLSKLLYYLFLKKIREVRLLEYVNYQKKKAQKILKKELNWQYYGGHHHESLYTQFIQSYYLNKKFNIDKRKTEYSAFIRSGQMNRENALKEIRENPYPVDKENINYVLRKLDLTKKDLKEIMAQPPKSFLDYPTYFPIIKTLRLPIKIAVRFNLIPEIFYYKYSANLSSNINKFRVKIQRNMASV